jgi:predicted transposase YdaD
MSSKPFDATLKDLIETDLGAWLALAGLSGDEPAALIDADLSTLTAAADKVVRVEEPSGPSLLNLELQASYDADVPERLHLYSTLLRHRHGLFVRSVLVLLRREANAGTITGILRQQLPAEVEPYDVFRYRVIRLWEHPLGPLLQGGLGTLPLAPLTDGAVPNLQAVVGQIDERLRVETGPPEAAKLRTATFVLMGLRYPEAVIEHLFQGVTSMEESSTYQLIIRKGKAQGITEGEKKLLLLMGRKKFGPPDEAAQAALDRITDPATLERLSERLLDVSSWQELLSDIAR